MGSEGPDKKRSRRTPIVQGEANAMSAGVRAVARAPTSAVSIPPGISAEEHAAAMLGVSAEVRALTTAEVEGGTAQVACLRLAVHPCSCLLEQMPGAFW